MAREQAAVREKGEGVRERRRGEAAAGRPGCRRAEHGRAGADAMERLPRSARMVRAAEGDSRRRAACGQIARRRRGTKGRQQEQKTQQAVGSSDRRDAARVEVETARQAKGRWRDLRGRKKQRLRVRALEADGDTKAAETTRRSRSDERSRRRRRRRRLSSRQAMSCLRRRRARGDDGGVRSGERSRARSTTIRGPAGLTRHARSSMRRGEGELEGPQPPRRRRQPRRREREQRGWRPRGGAWLARRRLIGCRLL